VSDLRSERVKLVAQYEGCQHDLADCQVELALSGHPVALAILATLLGLSGVVGMARYVALVRSPNSPTFPPDRYFLYIFFNVCQFLCL